MVRGDRARRCFACVSPCTKLGASSRLSLQQPAQDHAKWLGVLSGMGSGFTSMIAHAGTPPFQFYVMPKGLDRDMYVGTSVLFFAATNLMKAPAFLALGQLSVSQLKTTMIFFPLAMASSWLGVRLVRTIDVRKFNFTITLILLCVSVALVSQGIAGFRESVRVPIFLQDNANADRRSRRSIIGCS